jgi:transposase
VRHLFAALNLAKGKLYGHIKPVKRRTQFLEFCRYLRTLYPREVRIAIVSDNFSPHLTTKKCQRVGTWAAANNVEMAYTPTDSSWLNRIEAHFTALRYFTLDGTDRRPQGTGQHDPPLHHLAKPPRRRPAPARPRRQSERCLSLSRVSCAS